MRLENNQKKRRTKWWIALGATVTILAGASLGALSAYNWSPEETIEGLFGISVQQSLTQQNHEERSIDEDVKEMSRTENDEKSEEPADPVEPDENAEGDTAYPDEPERTPETMEEPTYVQGVLIANKEYPLPTDYAPGEDPEARAAYDEMQAAAAEAGHSLVAFSTFRSYDYQTDLYNRYVEQHGQEEADRFSARPGYSEHQTGLGFDIGAEGQEEHWASDSFKDTKEAKWLAENAHQYGFILRYPAGKEHITGYQYESWHFRYLGEELATKVYESGLTLEEYLGI
ncbi:serine-type D-Ala-D-Ala carboxypeptidase [Jeotgalibacillus malaysiensis]|uniref:Serine-type D-Ala-D-Ala carboxypeptidase n=1 Tax=Jeotgalibacillus malaysiensis TaxID=1508404 RepID=A0A0B5AI97_9BACL|nr:M15 family metallopeptidase [Jeotgalibacillus malaysiensis]AJD90110.1 serine-type D-Ala-D-Ala carboxypeptidase [Jeotgalibacillus malaysiensis]